MGFNQFRRGGAQILTYLTGSQPPIPFIPIIDKLEGFGRFDLGGIAGAFFLNADRDIRQYSRPILDDVSGFQADRLDATRAVIRTPGTCRDAFNQFVFELAAGLDLTIDTAVVGPNGLDVAGIFAIDTWLAVYIIGSDTDPFSNPIAGLLSANFGSPNVLPPGYSRWRRLGTLRVISVNALPEFRPQVVTGFDRVKRVIWDVDPTLVAAVTAGTALVFTTLDLNALGLVGPGADTWFGSATANVGLGGPTHIKPTQLTGIPPTGNGTIRVESTSTVIGPRSWVAIEGAFCGTVSGPAPQSIDYRVTVVGEDADIYVSGYEETL